MGGFRDGLSRNGEGWCGVEAVSKTRFGSPTVSTDVGTRLLNSRSTKGCSYIQLFVCP